jgi:hypothetical protein
VEKAIGGGCEGRVQLLEQPGKTPRYFLSKDHPYHHDGLRYTVVYVDVRIRVRASVRWDDHDPSICTSVYIGVFRYTIRVRWEAHELSICTPVYSGVL